MTIKLTYEKIFLCDMTIWWPYVWNKKIWITKNLNFWWLKIDHIMTFRVNFSVQMTIEKLQEPMYHYHKTDVWEYFLCEMTHGWLRSVGSIKLQVSFAEYRLFSRALLQKRPIILSMLLTEATPYKSDLWEIAPVERLDDEDTLAIRVCMVVLVRRVPRGCRVCLGSLLILSRGDWWVGGWDGECVCERERGRR